VKQIERSALAVLRTQIRNESRREKQTAVAA
jgi:hypothetical protein